MSSDEKKAVVSRMVNEVIMGGNLDLMDELVAPDFINHNTIGSSDKGDTFGVEPFRQQLKGFREAFPDVKLSIIHLLVDGDLVTLYMRNQATHMGPFVSIPATGKKIDIVTVTIIRVVNGKFAERWSLVDRYNMFRQLGVIPNLVTI